MLEVAQGGDAPGDDLVALAAVHVDDERDATGVVLELRAIETLRDRERTLHASSFRECFRTGSGGPGTTLSRFRSRDVTTV